MISSGLKDELPYKETIHRSIFILLTISLLLTLTIDLSIYLYLGLPELSLDRLKWCAVFSMLIFAVAFFYSALRYRVKLKVFQGITDDRIFISIKGVGKGALKQIPVDSVISCTPENYSAPMRGFPLLLLTSNAPVKYSKSTSIISLPGYTGLGVNIQYIADVGLEGESRNLLVPAKNPDILCGVIKRYIESVS
jgi:hypothetical protein